MNKEDILDEGHWLFKDYKQRILDKLWRELLLNNDDSIIFRGRVTQLIAKRLGYGVVEVTKELE